MRASVTNLSRGARGFQQANGSTRFVEPGETALLDLADHALHRAWAAAGDVSVAAAEPPGAPSAAPPDKTARRGRASPTGRTSEAP